MEVRIRNDLTAVQIPVDDTPYVFDSLCLYGIKAGDARFNTLGPDTATPFGRTAAAPVLFLAIDSVVGWYATLDSLNANVRHTVVWESVAPIVRSTALYSNTIELNSSSVDLLEALGPGRRRP
jgi:hypothetical protein